MRRIAVISCLFALSASASYDSPSDPSPDAVQAYNPSHAPDPICRTNEEYTQCATHCEASCSNPNPVCIRSCAPAQCQCVYGYLRNEYGECVAASSCPATTQEPTTTEATYETTTLVPIVYAPEPLYYNNTQPAAPSYYVEPSTTTSTDAPATYAPAPEYSNEATTTAAPAYEEPATTTQAAYQPSETSAAPASNYTPDETPAPAQIGGDYTSASTPAPSSEYSPASPSSSSSSTTPADDDDVILVGGSCSENTCRVGFRCDDSSAAGAKCVPYDTRARSSCSEVRCRPGWSCVVAMDGPRCYRNSVLGITDAPSATGYSDSSPPSSDYATSAPSTPSYGSDASPSADEPLSPSTPAEGTPSCASVICPFGMTCFDASSPSSSAFCRLHSAGRDSSPQPCSEVQCGPDETCADHPHGPLCAKNAPATCAATSCLVGSRCVESPEGAKCEEALGPQVFAGKTCAVAVCPSLHQCFDTVDGASCYPIPTDPVEPTPAEATLATAEKTPEPQQSEQLPLAREGSSHNDCEHLTCSSGDFCAIDFEGKAYCRTESGATSPSPIADAPTPSPPSLVPVCAEITCPSEHECIDDSVKGAACWPLPKEDQSKDACRNFACRHSEICIEESSGPRCVSVHRRGMSAPGHRLRI